MIHTIMRWEGGTPEHYEALRKRVKWDSNLAKGGVFHAASYDGKALRLTDVWESVEDMNNFVNNRLMPAVAELGIPGQPEVEVFPLQAYVAPGFVHKTWTPAAA